MKFLSYFRNRIGATLPTGVTLTTPAPVAAQPVPPAPSEVDALTAKISSLTAERDQANAAFSEITAAMQALAADRSEVITARDTAFAERDAAKAIAAKTREEITAEVRQIELAALAASQGIPAAEIVPASGPGADPEQALTDTLKEMQATTDPAKRGVLAAKASALRATLKNKK